MAYFQLPERGLPRKYGRERGFLASLDLGLGTGELALELREPGLLVLDRTDFLGQLRLLGIEAFPRPSQRLGLGLDSLEIPLDGARPRLERLALSLQVLGRHVGGLFRGKCILRLLLTRPAPLLDGL